MTPRGLPRTDAAEYVGCSPRMFDGMVKEGKMPCPRLIGSKKIWDTFELNEAFDELPRAEIETSRRSRNEWDEN